MQQLPELDNPKIRAFLGQKIMSGTITILSGNTVM